MAFFDLPAARDRVPERYRWFATALLLTDDCRQVPAQLHRFWRDFGKAEAEMHMEGSAKSFVQDVTEFLGRANSGHRPVPLAPRGPDPAPSNDSSLLVFLVGNDAFFLVVSVP